jgi:hypothetical protein
MNKEIQRLQQLAGIKEMRLNTPGGKKLKVNVSKDKKYGRYHCGFNLDDNSYQSLFPSDFSKNYVRVYLNEDDIYSDGLHEDIINFLNKNRIPFEIYDTDNYTRINGDEFEIPEDPEDMFDKEIFINKRDCIVKPPEYREIFMNL